MIGVVIFVALCYQVVAVHCTDLFWYGVVNVGSSGFIVVLVVGVVFLLLAYVLYDRDVMLDDC